MEYNTNRGPITLKEYGRNVQKLVDHIRNQPDKKKRTDMAYTLIELIKQLAPIAKDTPENPQRNWDDLYIIADFNLDLDSPYPMPEREVVFKKPRRMPYPQTDVKYKHYGKNVERLIKEASKLENPEERQEAIIYLGKLMKTFYSNWNKESLDDSVIVKDIRNMSNGTLNVSIEKVREDNLFEKLYREKKKPHSSQAGNSGNERGDRGDRSSNNNNNNNNERGDRGDRKQRHGGRPFNKNRGHNHRRRDQ
ncbi:MAG TPA: DUF4290 domain-containing protein [Cyclobacteriaceae bacterium]|nr:DUF4290 domain-containing protein [Cyclobacteriaceae bacterium]